MKSVLLWSTPLFLLALMACSSDGSVPAQGGGGAGSGHGGASGHGETSAAGQPTGSSTTTTTGTSSTSTTISSASSSSSSGSGSTTSSSGSGSTTSSSGTSTSTSSGGGTPVLPFCQQVCASVADCAIPNVPAYDSSHYACNSGVCAYTGCKSDAECSTLFQKPAVCSKLNGATIPSCYPACTGPADCAIPNVPAYDASHYACDSGACAYTGCKSDAECSMLFQKPGVCSKLNGATIPSCYPACTSPADCAIPNVPAYDASHYACDSGACAYTGCKSDAECSMILQKPATCQ